MKNVQPPTAVGKASVALTALLAIALLAAGQTRSNPPVRDAMPPPPPEKQAAPADAEPAKPAPAEVLSVRLPPPPAPKTRVETVIAAMTPLPEPALVPVMKPPPPAPRPEPAAEPEPVPLRIVPLTPDASPVKAHPVAIMRPPLVPETANKAPTPVPEPAVQPLPRVDTPPRAAPVAITRETVVEGRTLLRLLEHGKGPRIEIAWPSSAGDRRTLYRQLTRCLGMRTAMMDTSQRLYAEDMAAGRSWTLDTDRYSGFMRQPAGALVAAERAVVDRIRARHGRHLDATVRLFPRRVDAVLLGGLRQAIGGEARQSIRAHYRLAGTDIVVTGIVADGTPVDGRIDLSRAFGRQCR